MAIWIICEYILLCIPYAEKLGKKITTLFYINTMLINGIGNAAGSGNNRQFTCAIHTIVVDINYT